MFANQTRPALPSFFTIALLFLFAAANAQNKLQTYLSQPTNLPLIGWNKTLLLHDGRTVVIHLENKQPSQILIFDSSRNQVVNKTFWFTMTDETNLYRSEFKGFYEINGYPVLFIQQARVGLSTLFRIQINPDDGKIVDEQMVHQSKTIREGVNHFVAKADGSDSYAVFYFGGHSDENGQTFKVSFWNGKHQKTKSASFLFNDFDLLRTSFLDFSLNKNGDAYAALGYYRSHDNKITGCLKIGRLKGADTVFTTQDMPVSDSLSPYVASFRNNTTTGNEYLLVMFQKIYKDTKSGYYKYITTPSYLLIFDQEKFGIHAIKKINNDLGTQFLQTKTRNNAFFRGSPIKFLMNNSGVANVVSEALSQDYGSQTKLLVANFGPLCLTEFNNDGEELTGTILPKSQKVPYFLDVDHLVERVKNKPLFRNAPTTDYHRQFTSFDCMNVGNDYLVVYNDQQETKHKTITETVDKINFFVPSEASYSFVDNKGEIKKQTLFGEPADDENHSLMVESGTYNEDRKIYSALVSVRKGDKVQLCLGWCQVL